ncbi:MAG: AMP-binding protein [Aquiluna sp.]
MHTIGDWLRLNYRRHPGKEALVGADSRLTYGELAERSWQLARGLASKGVSKGEVVGVLAGNSVFNAELYFGIASLGAVYGAYNWRWAAVELAGGVKESSPNWLLCEDRFRALAEEAMEILAADPDFAGTIPAIVSESEMSSLRAGEGEFHAEVSIDDPLCLIYTGGSTGVPKAVVLSHRAAVTNSINEMVSCELGVRPDDRGLVLTPMFHSAALLCWLTTHFISGATSIIAPQFDEETMVDLVERERVTNTFMIPNMMRRVMQAGVFSTPAFQQTFRALHTGAGLLRMPDKERFREILPNADLFFRYGLTEAGPQVTRLHTRDMLNPEVDGSIGEEYFGVEAEVKYPGSDEICAPGDLGEICVRGPSLMWGYLNRPEATAEAIQGGWLRTGDLAVRDERGYFFFRDRLKEMIKTGGENVYSAEVEQVLYTHPGVLEAAVVGVPDLKWDEEVRAVIVVREGQEANEEDLKAHVRTQLAGYKVPKVFEFVAADFLPRSAAGKLEKSKLKTKLGWLPEE